MGIMLNRIDLCNSCRQLVEILTMLRNYHLMVDDWQCLYKIAIRKYGL